MNPSTGTFISMDTYEGSIYDPDTLHKYLYANGNPVKYSDPTGNFFSAAGMLISTTLNSIYNNFETLNTMGILSGFGNATVTQMLGGSDQEITKAFLDGYFTGFALGTITYVVAAYEILTLAQVSLLIASADAVVSMVLTIGSIMSGNKKQALVYGVLSIISLFTFCKLYDLSCTANVVGNKGTAKIKYDNSISAKDAVDAQAPKELVDGESMKVNEILDIASDFLGKGYTEPIKGSGRFVS